MFCSLLCSVQILCRVLLFIAFCSLSRSVQIRYILFCSITFCRVISCFLFNKMDCTYTLLYIIDKGGRKNFLREDVSAVLRDEALSAFENIVIGFHEYKSTTLTP